MTPAEHYKEAERLVQKAADDVDERFGREQSFEQASVDLGAIANLIAAAQVHATLALGGER